MNITIDQEFKSLIPPLTTDEYQRLEESIKQEGCRDALVLWGDILIDGHNRYEICTSYDIPFQTTQKEFASRDDVKLWMMNNQLARRNLNDFQRVEITHKCEDVVAAKAAERQASTRFGGGGNISTTIGKARDELGKLAGVSGKTYEHAVTVLETAPEPVVEATRQNDLSIHAAYQVTRMEPGQQQEIVERIEQGEKPKDVVSDVQHRPHVANNSGCNEWYTPKKYIDLVKQVLGEIDLDPASCEYANNTIQAKRYYTIEEDGLSQTWNGKVWMNPPYQADLVQKFASKFISEYMSGNVIEGIVLVNNATETAWFSCLIEKANAIAFPQGRIRYESDNRQSLAPLQGQAFLYFGNNEKLFLKVFSEIGWGAIIYHE